MNLESVSEKQIAGVSVPDNPLITAVIEYAPPLRHLVIDPN
jgi:hypothetical protein